MAFVQGAHNASAAVSSNTIAATFSGAVGSGNTVIGIVSWTSTETLNSVSDGTNTYHLETTLTDSTDTQSAAVFSFGNITTGPTVITATFSSASLARSIAVAEYSGISAVTDPRDGHGGQLQASPGVGTDGISSGSGNCVTTVNGDTVVGLTADTSGPGTTVISHGTGYSVIRVNDSTAGCAALNIEDLTQGTASSTTVATFTQNANDVAITWAVGLKASAAGDVLHPQAWI